MGRHGKSCLFHKWKTLKESWQGPDEKGMDSFIRVRKCEKCGKYDVKTLQKRPHQ